MASFPGPGGRNELYYSDLWRGFRRHISELKDYNLDIVELPYYPNTIQSQANELVRCLDTYDGAIDGLLTVGHFEPEGLRVVREYTKRGIPLFLCCDDAAESGRIACVTTDYAACGRIAAELLCSQMDRGSAVMLLAGDAHLPSHYQMVAGFEGYLTQHDAGIRCVKLEGYYDEQELAAQIDSALAHENIQAAVSVSARLSLLLVHRVESLGFAGRLRIIASDLFRESVHYLKQGVISQIIYKDPQMQAYLAAKAMSDMILKAQKPDFDVQQVESRIIFCSSLTFFDGSDKLKNL